jgi:transcriptional regulator with XRE-family HTH domain
MWLVNENLKYLRKKNNITQESFGAILGIKRSLVGAYEEKRAHPKLEVVERAAKYFNLEILKITDSNLSETSSNSLFTNPNPDSKETGETLFTKMEPGPTKAEEPKPAIENASAKPVNFYYQQQSQREGAANNSELSFKGPRLLTLSVTVDSRNTPNIEYIAIEHAQAYIESYGKPEFLIGLPKFFMPNLNPVTYNRVFEIADTAISAIPVGSYAICEFVKDWHQISPEKKYVVVSNTNGICCRKLTSLLAQKGLITLRSDFPDKEVIALPTDSILEIWEVVSCLHHFSAKQEPARVGRYGRGYY